MNSVAEREDTIVQEITIKGAAERIFAALLDPAELMEWWRATGKFEVTHMETDLRVGGKWMMRVKGNCGPNGLFHSNGRVSGNRSSTCAGVHLVAAGGERTGVDGALGSQRKRRGDDGSRDALGTSERGVACS